MGLPNRLFYTYKFNSAKLKACGWEINTGFDEAHELGEVVSLADSQMLRLMRRLRKRVVLKDRVERLYREREVLRKRCTKRRHTLFYAERLKEVKDRINRTMFVPDYITVSMDHPSHYKYLSKYGFTVNGHRYKRLSCSAGQARVSTVVFCDEEILADMKRLVENGRDPNIKIAPSKFNAYFGLAGSATFQVTEPRFCVVPDFNEDMTFPGWWGEETDWDLDDEMIQKDITMPMNRADGQGLISPELAAQWAKDLGLDYVPYAFIIRHSFLKGMVCVFDFKQFCREVNGGNMMVPSVYRDEDGNQTMVDLSKVDLIVSESQFKLWNGWKSQEAYEQCYHENGLIWGVAQYSPKVAKNVLTMNYQFLQTLDLDEGGVKDVCSMFVGWMRGVSFEKREYMMLFLLGVNNTADSVKWYLKSSENHWVKALIANPECAKDPYIRGKIRDLMRKRIGDACMGEIILPGNFQTMIVDPYAQMQHICGLEITGLLKGGEFYSRYWNERGVGEVNLARSPQTWRCENVVGKLVQNEQTEKWYGHLYLGVVFNWYDNACVRLGGADFDGDIVASTSCRAVIDHVFRDELTVTYDIPSPVKKIVTEEDLIIGDQFTFGSQIGALTNKSTNAYAILPLIEEKYGKDSEEARLIVSRLRQCCIAQSKQIDKAKIGRPVKCIPKAWIQRNQILETDTEDEKKYKTLMNHCLIERRPYFFKHRYQESKKAYEDYRRSREAVCRVRFGIGVDELRTKENKTDEELAWMDGYDEYCPLTESKSPMNLLCKYLENTDFGVKEMCRVQEEFDASVYMDMNLEGWEDYYDDVVRCYARHLRDNVVSGIGKDKVLTPERAYEKLREGMSFICSNPGMVVNCLVKYLLLGEKRKSADVFWRAYGKQLARHAAKNSRSSVMFPLPKQGGSIHYLGGEYEMQEVYELEASKD